MDKLINTREKRFKEYGHTLIDVREKGVNKKGKHVYISTFKCGNCGAITERISIHSIIKTVLNV
jgi:hypothetical protein